MRKHVLYVGGLSQATQDDRLKGLFAMYGLVPWVQIVRHPTGRSAGYGFVQMGSPAQALHAVVELDGSLFNDGYLEVYATPSGVHRTRERGQHSDRRSVHYS